MPTANPQIKVTLQQSFMSKLEVRFKRPRYRSLADVAREAMEIGFPLAEPDLLAALDAYAAANGLERDAAAARLLTERLTELGFYPPRTDAPPER